MQVFDFASEPELYTVEPTKQTLIEDSVKFGWMQMIKLFRLPSSPVFLYFKREIARALIIVPVTSGLCGNGLKLGNEARKQLWLWNVWGTELHTHTQEKSWCTVKQTYPVNHSSCYNVCKCRCHWMSLCVLLKKYCNHRSKFLFVDISDSVWHQ